MKYYYIAVTIEENGKYYSYVIRTNDHENLLSKLKIKNIVTAVPAHTKKRAAYLVTQWNAIAKENNIYLFDEPF